MADRRFKTHLLGGILVSSRQDFSILEDKKIQKGGQTNGKRQEYEVWHCLS